MNIPVPVLVEKFNSHHEIKNDLLKILENQNHISFNNEFDKITKTDWYSDVGQTREYWKFLFPKLFPFIQDIFVNKLGANKDKFLPEIIANYWFQQYCTGDTHCWHTHPASTYNVVYYVELPDGTPSTELKSPLSEEIFKTNAKEGDVLIFPSFLIHRSPVNTSIQRKTVIAFNID